MSLTLISPPASEPVTLAELKEYLKLDSGAEDQLLAGLIAAARQVIEARFQLAILLQSWRLALDEAPDAQVFLPLSPVLSIDAVGVMRGSVTEALPLSAYDAQAGMIGRVKLKQASLYGESAALVISFTAGWANASAVPDPIRLAIKVCAAHLYENREGAVAAPDISALVAPYKRVRL